MHAAAGVHLRQFSVCVCVRADGRSSRSGHSELAGEERVLPAQGVQFQHIAVSPDHWTGERHKRLHAGGAGQAAGQYCSGGGAYGAGGVGHDNGRKRAPLHLQRGDSETERVLGRLPDVLLSSTCTLRLWSLSSRCMPHHHPGSDRQRLRQRRRLASPLLRPSRKFKNTKKI